MRRMTKKSARRHTLFGRLAVIVVFAAQAFVAQAGGLSDVGLDPAGREAVCRMFDGYHVAAFEGDVRVRCEGADNEMLVVDVEKAGLIWVGTKNPAVTVRHLSRPYDDTTYQYNRLMKYLPPAKTPAEEIIQRLRAAVPHYEPDFTRPADTTIGEKLRALGVVTMGDLYAASGFKKYIIRDAHRHKTYLELSLSNKNYGKNPTVEKLITKYPKTIMLFGGTGACGRGEFFSTIEGRYAGQETGWLRTVLNFAYSGSEMKHITFETVASLKVTIREMEALMVDRDFAAWVGREGLDRLRELIEQRRRLYANEATLSRVSNQFFKHPIVKSYLASLNRLVALMKQKFDLIKWDDGTVC